VKADRNKLELALARACMTPETLTAAAEMPRPTVNNVITVRRDRQHWAALPAPWA